MGVIDKRYEFVMFFDVTNGNPNGDPDEGGRPRIDRMTGCGLVSDVCIKRKIRNYVSEAKDEADGYRIYIQNDASLRSKDAEVCESVGVSADDKAMKDSKKKDPNIDEKLRDGMCKSFYDVRAFGGVITTFTKVGLNCGQINGPVQINFAQSIDPISPRQLTITRMAVTTEKDFESKSNEMASKYIVPYGLYRCEGYISAKQAQKVTGFTEEDLELFWTALVNMFDTDHSSMRGKMATRALYVFEHESALGNAPSHVLFNLVTAQRKESVAVARSIDDYEIVFHEEGMPTKVKWIKKI